MNFKQPVQPAPYFSGFAPLPEEFRGKIWERGTPFWFRSEPHSDGVILCLHGFTASPFEVRPVAEACRRRGFDGAGTLLPGHGYAELTDQKLFFSRMTAAGMLEAARAEIAEARSRYNFVGIFGHSMGGAIALKMAAEGRVDACAVTAPALKLPPRAVFLLALLGRFNISLNTKPQRFDNPIYLFENTRAGVALQQLARQGRDCLSQVACPVFAVHSHADRLVDPVVMDWMRSRVSGELEIRWFNKSSHVMTLDVNGPEIADAIGDFFVRVGAGDRLSI